MRYLITIITILFAANTQAQQLSVYADMFTLKGQPQTVKQYYEYDGTSATHYGYFLIEYNYEKQERAISFYHISPKSEEHHKRWTINQSIKPEDLKNSYLCNYIHTFDMHLGIAKKEYKEDGTIVLHSCKDTKLKQRTNDQGRVIVEKTFDKNGQATFSHVHTYSPDGKIRYSHTINKDGEKVTDLVVKYDEQNNPIWVKGTGADGEEFTLETMYDYDEFGNFISSTEIEDGKVNRRVVREITY